LSEDFAELREETLASERPFIGKLLAVRVDQVALPDGRRARREIVEHAPAIAAVPLLDDGRVVLVRQWRHAAGRSLWELPAGTREVGEKPAATARRELIEETGYRARDWREMAHGPVSPGYSSEEIWFFAASGLTAGATSPDADELLDVKLFAVTEIADLARLGEVDLKTLAGLALAGITLGGAGG
jgi:ADP-ribose pyrophosphatase